MAQSNVMREPSMDEILASIRRIIESNDPIPASGLATPVEPEGFSGSPANDAEPHAQQASRNMVPPVMPEARPVAPAAAAQPATAPLAGQDARDTVQKPLSLADVAARVRAASERNNAIRDMQARSAPTPEVPAMPAADEIPAEKVADAVSTHDEPVVAAVDLSDEEDVHLEIDDELEARAAEIDRMNLGSSRGALAINPFEAAAEAQITDLVGESFEMPADDRQSLVSRETGLQVARSFDDLVSAMNLSQQRSLDEVAEDLLRPMLQEWLDDNLPTLVERLVREEIERVARGPRR